MSSTQYRLVQKLGVGGMAEVYLAQQQGLAGFEKLVVVKRVLPQLREDAEFINMLLAEARLAAGLRHPNIVEIYDVRREAGEFLIVMEYLAGEDLRFILNTARKEEFQIPVGVAGRVVSDAAAGLAYAHRAVDAHGRPLGVVHRDIGPTNVMLTYHGVGKVLDFGVAKANIHNIYTRPGTLKGKYGYSSPEQVRHRPLDARSDVFSLGIVLHELLTGRRLFKGRTPPDTLKAVMEAPIVPPSQINPEVPPELDDVVLRALERNRSKRISSAGQLQEELELALERHGLLLNHHAVATWMSAVLAEAKDRRLALEARAARDEPVPQEGPEAALLPPVATPPPAHHSSGSSQASWQGSGSGQASWQQSSLHSQPQPPGSQRKVGLVVLLSSLVTLLVVLLVTLAFWLGREGSRGEVVEIVRPPAAPAAEPAPTQVALHLHVVPAGATLKVDGEPWPHPIGEAGVLIPRDARAPTRLVIDKPGFGREARSLVAPAQGTQNVYVTLSAEAATEPEAPDEPPRVQRAEAPPPVSPPRPRRAPRARPSGRAVAAKSEAATGSLALRVSPERATVLVDGTPRPGGAARAIEGLAPGAHTLSVRAEGYAPYEETFDVQGGEPVDVSVTLVAIAPKMATLDVTSRPAGAQVKVDGKLRGTSPVLGLQLSPGQSHSIELTLAGHEPWTTQVNPAAGANPPVQATLTPLASAPSPAPAASRRGLVVPKSMVGEARPGRDLFRERCEGCHDGGRVPRVREDRYTRAQWSRYFARARHARHANLSETFRQAELADVKAYLLSTAADVESDTAAGVR